MFQILSDFAASGRLGLLAGQGACEIAFSEDDALALIVQRELLADTAFVSPTQDIIEPI